MYCSKKYKIKNNGYFKIIKHMEDFWLFTAFSENVEHLKK